MVAPQSASEGSSRSAPDGFRTALRSPATSLVAVGLPIALGLGIAGLVAPAELRAAFAVAAWIVAIAFGALVAAAGLTSSTDRVRSNRRWFLFAYALATAWAISTGVLRTVAGFESATPADLLLAGSLAAGSLPFARLVARLPRSDLVALALDVCCVFLAAIALGAAALAVVTGTHGLVLWVSVYPIAFVALAAFAGMAVLATQSTTSARGLHLLLGGLLLAAGAIFVWVGGWVSDPGSSAVAPGVFAPLALLVGAGIATSGSELAAASPLVRRRAWYVDAIPLVAVALVAATSLAESAGAFVLPMVRIVVVVVVAVAIAREAILLNARTNLVRRLLEADEQTRDALRRAAIAEEIASGRADRLTAILEATGQLALAEDRRTELSRVLESLTLPGAASFLMLVGESGHEIAAAFGAGSPPSGPIERSAHDLVDAAPETRLAYFSLTGQRRGGTQLLPAQVARFAPGVQAALAVQLVYHDGEQMGVLHVVDRTGERVLEPTYIALTQLVAARIAVAVENRSLLDRLQHELDEVQRVQAELVQATKLGAVAELAAAVAHEVNNPLTGILGFAELLLAELPAGDPRREEVAVIRSEAVRAREIVRTLLELARPREPQRSPTNINDLVRASVDLLRYRIEEAGVWVVDDYHELPSVDVDPDAMRQVVLNLLNNAVEAMPGGGEMRIATRVLRDRIAVSIADNGVGMSDETRRRIFTPFFTMRPGSTRGVQGGGLGLAVSYRIVQSHGGTIDVESAIGMGSMFTVELPLDADAAATDRERPPLVAIPVGVTREGAGGPEPPTFGESGKEAR